MCTGMELLVAAGATAVATQMAKSGPDPAAERAAAERKATEQANAVAASRKKAVRASSLLSTGSQSPGGTERPMSVLAQGKPTTGG